MHGPVAADFKCLQKKGTIRIRAYPHVSNGEDAGGTLRSDQDLQLLFSSHHVGTRWQTHCLRPPDLHDIRSSTLHKRRLSFASSIIESQNNNWVRTPPRRRIDHCMFSHSSCNTVSN